MTMVQETAKRILALLPGVDCGGFGGCGHPTCQACAEAIAEGACVNLCPAADQKAVDAIAEVMGVDTVEVEKKIAFIKCAGCSAGKERFAACGCESCDAAKNAGFEKGECQYGCIGLGTCIDRCKFDAMTLVDGEVVIDKEKCSGCEACLSGCIQTIIEMVPADASNFIPCSSMDNEKDTLSICGYGCIGCADCALACPKDAIEMVNGDSIDGRYARIDYSKCEGCITCTVKCRKKIIVDTLHDLTQAKETVALVRCVGGSVGHNKLEAAGYESCKQIMDEKVDLDSLDACAYSCAGFSALAAATATENVLVTRLKWFHTSALSRLLANQKQIQKEEWKFASRVASAVETAQTTALTEQLKWLTDTLKLIMKSA